MFAVSLSFVHLRTRLNASWARIRRINISNHVLLKDDQDIERIEDYREKYELD